MNERAPGALSSIPFGNLKVSWYYYLPTESSVVKRSKATSIPITDDIISFMNMKSIGREERLNKPDILQLEEVQNMLLQTILRTVQMKIDLISTIL